MLKTILRWFLGFVLLLLLAAGITLYYANDYLESNQEKLLQDYMSTKGLNVQMREVRLEIWKDFPHVSFTVDSLVVRDTTRSLPQPELINAQRVRTQIDLDNLLLGRIQIEEIIVYDAVFHLESDSSGTFNYGHLGSKDTTSTPPEGPGIPSPLSVDWEGLMVDLDRVTIRYIHPPKNKRIIALARCVQSVVDRTDAGELHAVGEVDLDVETLAFNTQKGGYLQDSRLTGPVQLIFGDSLLQFPRTDLVINGQLLRLAADIRREKEALSHIVIEADSIGYEPTRAILNADLQDKLDDYFVSGRFPVRADIVTPLSSGSDPEVTLAFRMTGQDVRLKQHQFRRVYGRGSLVNRLTVAEGGIPDSKKNIRVLADDVQAVYLGNILIETPHAKVAVAGKDPILRSDLHFSGPASAVSDYLNNDAFFFRRGRFSMDATVSHSLLDFEGLVQSTDGEIQFYDTQVAYEPAEISFPFKRIEVGKTGQDILFEISSAPISTGFEFELMGDLDNLAPLLIDLPAGQINTNVAFHTEALNWTDFRALFGEGGELANLADGNEPDTTLRSQEPEVSDARQVAAMKATLMGLENTFNPSLSARFDTLAYYDVFDVTGFSTGLHFSGDTLVLEKTSFDWAGSNMKFGARLDLNEPGSTDFKLNFLADHLNVNRIRDPLDYFGLQLPKELDELPDDLHIELAHSGRIADSIGIVMGHNSGKLAFNDGRAALFSGTLDYTPSAGGLHTIAHLEGDPQVVNALFAAENFFFGEGHFEVDLDVTGNPEDVAQIVRTGTLDLSISDSRIHYRPADVFIPVKSFSVGVADERADYALQLVTDSTNRSVNLVGHLNRLATFLFPDSTATAEPFTVEADLTAEVLGYEDLTEFIQTGDTSNQDTGSFNLKRMLSATGGVFNSFRPNMSLRVDTFHLKPGTALLNVTTGLSVRNNQELLLERTGFKLDDGSEVALDAVYALDSLEKSPFSVNWRVDNLDAGRLFGELKEVLSLRGDSIGSVRGHLSLTGNMTGYLNEPERSFVPDSTDGSLTYAIEGLQLDDWLPLEALGKKLLMQKRFREVAIAPLIGELEIVNGVMKIPRTELQSSPLHLFIEGSYSLDGGPDLLLSVPVWKNFRRGVLDEAPAKMGYEEAGWKVFLQALRKEDGTAKTKFRLGRKKWDKLHE